MSGVTSWAERPGHCTIRTSQRDRFYRGRTSGAVQIDQPLSYAWQTATRYWTATKRVDFANDPRTAGRRRAGQCAGAGDVAWLPTASAYRCVYGTAQITVKTRYPLWAIPPGRGAMAPILSACPPWSAGWSTRRGLVV